MIYFKVITYTACGSNTDTVRVRSASRIRNCFKNHSFSLNFYKITKADDALESIRTAFSNEILTLLTNVQKEMSNKTQFYEGYYSNVICFLFI